MKMKTDSTTIRVMTYNIHHGEGMDGHINLDRIAALIHSANVDLVGLQEVDRNADRSHNLDMIKILARLMLVCIGHLARISNYEMVTMAMESSPGFPLYIRQICIIKWLNRQNAVVYFKW